MRGANGGRPSKYKEEYCEEVGRYLDECGFGRLPMVEDFAIRLGVSKHSIYRWVKKHKKFRDSLKAIKINQKKQLINDGIYGGKEVNSTIVKLLLQNNHGMKEKTDVTTGGEKLVILPPKDENKVQ